MMSPRYISLIGILASACLLLIIILGLDAAGVRYFDNNGLAFGIHCYSYGLTFYIAAITFFLFTRKICHIVLAIVLSFLCAAIWWVITFSILVIFHGAIGGWL